MVMVLMTEQSAGVREKEKEGETRQAKPASKLWALTHWIGFFVDSG